MDMLNLKHRIKAILGRGSRGLIIIVIGHQCIPLLTVIALLQPWHLDLYRVVRN